MVSERLPAETRIYAIGDVHGHADKLMAMHELIGSDLRRDPVREPLLIHLGDYIDRGPDSALCLTLLAPRPPLPGVPTVNLLGNHEWMLLNALDQGFEGAAELWLENGGDMALESWGIPSRTRPERWKERIPATQLAFLRSLALYCERGEYVFVHAGVRPGIPLAEQRDTDLLWIREEFLERDGPMLPGAPATVVVHGHTPGPAPVQRANRIGIDTNAARGGPLTCVVLGAGAPRFLQV